MKVLTLVLAICMLSIIGCSNDEETLAETTLRLYGHFMEDRQQTVASVGLCELMFWYECD